MMVVEEGTRLRRYCKIMSEDVKSSSIPKPLALVRPSP